MRRASFIIALALLAILGGSYVLWAYKSAHDEKAQDVAKQVLAAVQEMKRKSGSYPRKFDSPPGRAVWGILPGPEVTYHFDGANCVIYYNEWPLGPHNVLDCQTKEWHYED